MSHEIKRHPFSLQAAISPKIGISCSLPGSQTLGYVDRASKSLKLMFREPPT